MRVCLTNPTWKQAGVRGIRAGCRVPNTIAEGQHTFIPFPFTLAYATSRLETEGVTTELIDAIGEDIDQPEYLDRVVRFRPDLIVNEMSTQSHDLDLAVARELRERTGAPIVVCGPHPTALPGEILAHEFIDFILLGEYEQTLVELVQALQERRPLEEIQGLAYRADDGQPRIGSKRDLLEDLDKLPYPHRSTLPLRNYRVAGFPSPVLFMYASRGCPYRCTFCVWPQWFRSGSYRARSAVSVAEEIQHAQERYGPFGSIYFDDDTFNLGRERMLELADEFERRRFDIPWGCNARPDRFDDEMMERLARTGMFNIRVGVESGDPEILRRTKKTLKLDSVGRCIEMAHRNGVKVHVTFTIGLSGESWESVKRTVAFAKSLDPDSVAFTITTPFPGTEYFEEVVREGHLLTRDWSQFNVVSNSVIRTAALSREEIIRAEKYVMRKVYYSPRYLFRRLRYARDPAEVVVLAKKGLKFVMGRF
jgi:radical SAM superfamily enzyme YgiQ (UPF0313 family)